jgi:diacylglycerol O-acyltransferase
MQQLAGIDAGFLYMETPSLHMHTLKIVVLEAPDYDFALSRRALVERLARRFPFRRRLAPIPFGLGHPLWVQDESIDLEQHIHRRSCPAPGGLRELSAIVSEVAGTQLDRSRPLWELHVVEGMEHGQIAFVAKIHHCVADGVAALDLLLDLVVDEVSEDDAATNAPEPMPSRTQLLRAAAAEAWRRLRSFPGLVVRTVAGLLSLWRYARRSPGRAPTPFRTPTTPFNASLTPGRTFAVARLAMADVSRIKKHFGVTVNDVFLSICAGALRRYLEATDEIPDLPLLASIPISTRGPDEVQAYGNHLSNLITSLHTDVADPVERLHAVSAAMRDSKARHEALGPQVFESWVDYTPPHPYAASVRAWSALRVADHIQPPVNVIVSNVPGPREPLTPGNARITALYSVGPILEGIALNLTAWSYVDQLNVGLLACSDHDVDLWKLASCIEEAIAELLSACAFATSAPRTLVAAG